MTFGARFVSDLYADPHWSLAYGGSSARALVWMPASAAPRFVTLVTYFYEDASLRCIVPLHRALTSGGSSIFDDYEYSAVAGVALICRP